MRFGRAFPVGLLVAVFSLRASLACAQSTPPTRSEDEVNREAREHFVKGTAHARREEWDAALAEFLLSRELQPSRGNTRNAALCMRKLGRFDEALALYEATLRFATATPHERSVLENEMADLQASVGVLQLHGVPEAAVVTVDGNLREWKRIGERRELRLSAGSYQLRVMHDGSLPFERRVDLAGSQQLQMAVTLVPLTRTARLRVVSRDNQRLELYLDEVHIGATPWDGALAPGPHTLRSVGTQRLGTAPLRIELVLNQQREVVLAPTDLAGPLEVTTVPAAAEIAIDGVTVGRGKYRVGLPAGTHRVVVRLPGFRTATYTAQVVANAGSVLRAELEPLERPRFMLELRGGLFAGLAWGGDLRAGCEGSCSAGVPLGGSILLQARYRDVSGFGAGVHAGYLGMSESIDQRRATLKPQGRDPQVGSVDDKLTWHSLLVGVDGEYIWRGDWSWVLRAAIGALLGAVSDARSGSFRDSDAIAYTARRTISDSAYYLYVAPELHVERELGSGFALSFGLQVFVLTALHRPTWQRNEALWTGERDGNGYFPATTLAGRLLIVPQPFVALGYTF